MSTTITRTYQTALRGTALRSAVDRMLYALPGMNANYHSMESQWTSDTRAAFSSEGGVSGTITLVSGNPSTVTLRATLPGALVFMASQLSADLATLARQHLASAGGQSGGAVTSSARASSGVTFDQVMRGISAAFAQVPGAVSNVRDAVEGAVTADPNAKPGMREEHTPDVAEPTPLLQRKWVPWAVGGVAALGLVVVLLKKR